jgi:prepilin-type N-terminal cleavage/methylation domain-containing protein
MKTDSKNQRGYSLIELLIVVAIIGIIATISITYMVQAKQAARSASAVSSLRTIHSAEVIYKTMTGAFGNLTQLEAAGYLVDPGLGSGTKSGYTFGVALDDPIFGGAEHYYSVSASPIENAGINLHYFVDATGTIRLKLGSAATRTDPVIP